MEDVGDANESSGSNRIGNESGVKLRVRRGGECLSVFVAERLEDGQVKEGDLMKNVDFKMKSKQRKKTTI